MPFEFCGDFGLLLTASVFAHLLIPGKMRRPLKVAEEFGSGGPLHVEIGFGMGEILAQEARLFPKQNYLGIDLHGKRTRKVLKKLLRENIQNVRLVQEDAWVVFRHLLSARSVQSCWSYFPCPWPKRAHSKHRLFSTEFLKLLNSRLVEQGEFRLVTDFVPFRDWILEQIPGTGFHFQTQVIPPQFDTKFERKWRGLGQNEFYEICLRKQEHIPWEWIEDTAVQHLYVDKFDPTKFEFSDINALPAFIQKDYWHDPLKKRSAVHLLIAEDQLTQHLWVEIKFFDGRWQIYPLEGQVYLPTRGIQRALELVQEACAQTNRESNAPSV